LHELRKKINDKIAQSNSNYKLQADARSRLKAFNVSYVVKKLHACRTDPFQILKKLNDNVYVIDLSISSTFSIEDLVDYNGLDLIPLVDEPFYQPIFLEPFLFFTLRYFI